MPFYTISFRYMSELLCISCSYIFFLHASQVAKGQARASGRDLTDVRVFFRYQGRNAKQSNHSNHYRETRTGRTIPNMGHGSNDVKTFRFIFHLPSYSLQLPGATSISFQPSPSSPNVTKCPMQLLPFRFCSTGFYKSIK